jgi:MarR-like DNA-binding transcriptional regulator SgrR of sgrS sRNA
LFALLLVVLVASLTGAALGPRYGGHLTIGVCDLPSSLEPTVPTGSGSRLVQGLSHETLLIMGGDGALRPGLADEWTPSSAGKEWILRISSRARFHDGANVGSEDVIRSLRRFIRSSSAVAGVFAASLDGGDQYRLGITNDLPGLLAIVPSRLAIRFTDVYSDALVPLTAHTAAITGANGAGCGPFIPLNLNPRQGITLLAFADHVRGRPFIDRIRIDLHRDAAAVRAAFDGGLLGLGLGSGGDAKLSGTLILILDGSKPPFNQSALRILLRKTLDRKTLTRKFIPGGEPAPGLLLPELLASPESPYPFKTTAVSSEKITLAVSDDVPPLASQRVVAHLASLGLSVRIEVVGSSDKRPSSCHAQLTVFWPEVADPFLALHELRSKVSATGSINQALEMAHRETDERRRLAHLSAVQNEILASGVVVPIAYISTSCVAAPHLHGLRWSRGSELLLEDAWIAP